MKKECEINFYWRAERCPFANMEVTRMEIEEAPLKFRLHKMKTLVFSLELRFYDEVNKHLTLPEDFAEYFFKNESKLYVAAGNRYKF